MRAMSLSEMVNELRREALISQSSAHGVHLDPSFKQLLRRVQETEWMNGDWPQLNVVANKAISADTQYAEYPDGFVFEGIVRVRAKSDTETQWRTLSAGIGVEQYDLVDSLSAETDEQILRWSNYVAPTSTLAANMFEVWPIPSVDHTLRFEGKRKLDDLINDSDTSTLDGPLIVLLAAIELLATSKQMEAVLAKSYAARKRRELLKKVGSKALEKDYNMAGPV